MISDNDIFSTLESRINGLELEVLELKQKHNQIINELVRTYEWINAFASHKHIGEKGSEDVTITNLSYLSCKAQKIDKI